MKIKMLLPVLALIFATGMSFTTVSATDQQVTGYINGPNGWESVNVDCAMGSEDCKVRFLPNPTEYQVYATEDESTPLNSTSGEIIDL